MIFDSFRRLVLISIITLISLFLAGFGLRQLGLKQTYGLYKHPLLTTEPLDFFHPSAPNDLRLNPQITKNLIVAFDRAEQNEKTKTWMLYFGQETIPLNEAASGPWRGIFVRWVSRETFNIKDFIDSVHKLGLEKKMIVAPESPSAFREFKKGAPGWLFAVTKLDISFYRVLAGIYLEPFSTRDFDVFIGAPEDLGEGSLRERLIAEWGRRHVRFVLRIPEPKNLLALNTLSTQFPNAGFSCRNLTEDLLLVNQLRSQKLP